MLWVANWEQAIHKELPWHKDNFHGNGFGQLVGTLRVHHIKNIVTQHQMSHISFVDIYQCDVYVYFSYDSYNQVYQCKILVESDDKWLPVFRGYKRTHVILCKDS